MFDWEKVYDEHASALLLYARQWGHSRADAEDAVQEAFIKVLQSEHATGSDNPLPLLYKAVRWCALDRLRRGKRRSDREHKAHEDHPDVTPLFKTGMEIEERRALVEAALDTLPDEQREVLVMKIWGEQTFKDIASVLDISINTAASRYRYALASLRKVLNQELVYE